jgi:hypothetical protein
MKDEATVQKFIELRAQGVSFDRIGDQLQVSKPTLIEWSRCHQHLIQNLLHQQTLTLQERVELFRQQEWALHETMIARALEALQAFRVSRRYLPSLRDVALLGELASTLGRRACGMADNEPVVSADERRYNREWEAAIERVYGKQPS